LDNTDYLVQARLAHVTEAFPSSLCPLAQEKRPLASLAIACGVMSGSADGARQEALAARTIAFTGGRARMDAGGIVLEGDDGPLSADLHLHVQLKASGMWIMSQSLQWRAAHRDSAGVVAAGHSSRLPFSLEWTIAPLETGFSIAVALIAEGAITLDEFNVSLNLSDAFMDWSTVNEHGRFDRALETEDWQHLNADFAPGNWIQSSADSRSTITLHADSALGTVHPTALLTGGGHSGPLLQLLCSPGQEGRFTLQPGRHDLFSGRVTIDPVTEK
jgi:hypothetical protein